MKNFKKSNLLQEDDLWNEVKSIEEIREKFSALFLWINYDLITWKELVSLWEQIKDSGKFFQFTHWFACLSDNVKSLVAEIIFNKVILNIVLPQKWKDYSNFIFTQDYIELRQVQILLKDLVNDLLFVDCDWMWYIWKRIENVWEKLIEIWRWIK